MLILKYKTLVNELCNAVAYFKICCLKPMLIKINSLRQFGRLVYGALAQGASPQGRGFEPHSCHMEKPCALAGSDAV